MLKNHFRFYLSDNSREFISFPNFPKWNKTRDEPSQSPRWCYRRSMNTFICHGNKNRAEDVLWALMLWIRIQIVSLFSLDRCGGCDTLFPSLMLLEHHKEEYEHWSDSEEYQRPCCRRNRRNDCDYSDSETCTSDAESEDLERLL